MLFLCFNGLWIARILKPKALCFTFLEMQFPFFFLCCNAGVLFGGLSWNYRVQRCLNCLGKGYD